MDCVIRQGKIRYIRPECVFDVLRKLRLMIDRGKVWRRRYFVVSFLFFTGARVSEAIDTRRRDIRLAMKEITLTSLKKRKKKEGIRDVRTIPLDHVPTEVLEFWEKYLTGMDDYDRVIPMTRQGVHKLVKETFEKFGIKKVHPHLLRHAIGIWLAQNGIYETVIADFLGHADTRITSIYTRITGRHLRLMLSKLREPKLNNYL
ncbi:MAG: hypothetical protein DSY42_07855 [Aquifex sp.]|nr:MAG: hypothetical protein DSY42_07855 [Aquifex sp.]